MRSSNHFREAGFTLIEVVVALAIAGLGLALLVAATGSGIDNSTGASRNVQAVSLAQSRMVQVGRTFPLKAGEFDGDEGNGFRWHAHIGMPMLHGDTALFPVTVTERWRSGWGETRVSLYSERVGPP